MGQRHQLFVIAKIGHRYRVLAAVHHQCLFGKDAVSRCLQVLELLWFNAPMLRQELQAANDYDWKTLTPEAWRTRAERLAMTEQDKANEDALRVRRCDNDDGYSVYDITNPEKPRYCFMVGERSGPYDAEFVEAMAPIDAGSYLFLYEWRLHNRKDNDTYEGDPKDYVREKIASAQDIRDLNEYPLIEQNALLSAWPKEQLARSAHKRKRSTVEETPPIRQSLRAKAMKEVISRALQSDSCDLSWLDEAKQLPDFARKAFAQLVLHPATTAKPAGLHLLCHALKSRKLKRRKVVDLSYFSHLTSQQILQILSVLRPVTLTLPSMNCLTATEVRALALSPGLVDIRFGYTPNLDLAALTDALTSTMIRAFSHPELYKMSLVAKDRSPEDLHASASISKMINSHPICQAVYLGVQHRPIQDGELRRCKLSGAPAWAHHFSTLIRQRHDYFRSGALRIPSGAQVLPIPLQDISFDTQELLPRLYKAIAIYITDGDRLSQLSGRLGIGIAMSLATGSDNHIAPLPADLYSSWVALNRGHIEPFPNVRPIVHGEWTLIVSQVKETMNEMDEYSDLVASTVRHCLVTRSAAGLLMSYKLEDFLDLAGIEIDAGGMVKYLHCCNTSYRNGAKPAVTHCDRDEAHEAVQAMEIYNAALQRLKTERAAWRQTDS